MDRESLNRAVEQILALSVENQGLRWDHSQILQIWTELTGCEFGCLCEVRRQPEGHPAIFIHAVFDPALSPLPPHPDGEPAHEPTPPFLVSDLRNMLGSVARTGVAVISNHPSKSPLGPPVTFRHSELNNFCALPLLQSRNLVGVIALGNRHSGFARDTIAFLTPLVNAASLGFAAWKNNCELRQHHEVHHSLRTSFQSLLEDYPGLLANLSPSGEITQANDAYLRFFKRKLGDPGARFLLSDPAEDSRRLLESMGQLKPHTPTGTHEVEVESSTGTKHWFSWIDRAFYDHRGNLTGFQCLGRDITPEKRGQQILRRQVARWKGVLENAAIGVFLAEPAGMIKQANNRLLELLGYELEELRGFTDIELTAVPQRRQTREAHQMLNTGQLDSVRLEKNYLTKGFGTVAFDVSLSSIRDSSGQTESILGLVLPLNRTLD